MGSKIYKLFEYVYLIMAVLAAYVVITNWNDDRQRAYLFCFFVVLGIFMFFFKRNFRKRMEKRKGDK